MHGRREVLWLAFRTYCAFSFSPSDGRPGRFSAARSRLRAAPPAHLNQGGMGKRHSSRYPPGQPLSPTTATPSKARKTKPSTSVKQHVNFGSLHYKQSAAKAHARPLSVEPHNRQMKGRLWGSSAKPATPSRHEDSHRLLLQNEPERMRTRRPGPSCFAKVCRLL